MKKFTAAVAFILVGFVAYLPFELHECKKLEAIHGPKFFCIPIGFFTIPVFTALLLVLVLVLTIKRLITRNQ